MSDNKKAVLLIVGSLLFVVITWVIVSFFEMRTFNKFSDRQATVIDAMFAELRVMAD